MPEKETDPHDFRYHTVTDAKDGESKHDEPLPVDESDEDDPADFKIGG